MATQLSQQELTQVMLVALTEFRAVLGLDVPAQRIQTLLAIAATPGIEQQALAKELGGMGDATVSRQVADLSALNRFKEPGPNLVRQEADPMYRRRNLVTLTPGGTALLHKITEKANKALAKSKR